MSLRDGNGSHCTSVTIVTELRAGRSSTRVLGVARNVCRVQLRKTRCSAHTAFCRKVTWVKWRELNAVDVRKCMCLCTVHTDVFKLRQTVRTELVSRGEWTYEVLTGILPLLGAFAKLTKASITFVIYVRPSIFKE